MSREMELDRGELSYHVSSRRHTPYIAGSLGARAYRTHARAGPATRSMSVPAFTDEGDGILSCAPGTAADSAVYAAFREHCSVTSSDALADDARLLFKITVESNESSKRQQAKPVVFVGVPHGAQFAAALGVCNRMFCRTALDKSGESAQGAFLLEGGFGVNPNKSAGNLFMAYGNSLTFHTKVDFSRLAFAQ